MQTVTPWRFIALVDIPDQHILAGDIVVCGAGEPTRVLRYLPVNNGLVLNLLLQDQLAAVDAVIGTEKPIVDAMELAAVRRESTNDANRQPLKVIR